jgi:hypothetical protein
LKLRVTGSLAPNVFEPKSYCGQDSRSIRIGTHTNANYATQHFYVPPAKSTCP